MSAVLESRYRWLLRVYPPAYRRERAEEMIGTLMEAATPNQKRPPLREAVSLALRGLQARAGVPGSRTRRQVWGGALRVAVLLLLVHATAVSLARTGAVVDDFAAGELGLFTNAFFPLETVLVGSALLAVAAGRYGWGLLAAVTAYATTLVIEAFSFNTDVDYVNGEYIYNVSPWSTHWIQTTLDWALSHTMMLPLPLAVLLAIPLLRSRPPAAARPWAWLLAVPAAVVMLPTNFDATLGIQPWALIVVMAALLLWAAVDARATIAGGLLFLPLVLAPVNLVALPYSDVSGMPSDFWLWTAGYAAGIVVLLAVGTLRAHRQARI